MDRIKTYFKKSIKPEYLLSNIKIYCRNKSKEGNQIILEFSKKYTTISIYTLRIYTFKNYIKTNEEFKTITHYGNLETILTVFFLMN